MAILTVRGQQEPRLPADLRQHNLTTYNANLFNPVFSLNRNNPESVAFWSRWQWQAIDGDPTTLFLNYSRKLDDRSAAGVAFFQQNTGVFFDTGGVLNYAYQIDFSTVKLAFGLNLFAFKQTLADDRFQIDPNVPIPTPDAADDFILQMAPGVSVSIERLMLSVASENLIDYNFSAKESNTDKEDKIFMSLLSYDFPIAIGELPSSFLRPSMYLRTIPGQQNQVGFYTLLNTNKYWGQLGYNNFYGYGVGLGGTFFEHLSLGALLEIGNGSSIRKETSIELIAAYFLGKPDERHKIAGFEADDEENPLLELDQEKEQEELVQSELEKAEEIAADEKAEKRAEEKKLKEEAKQLKKREKAVQDSIAKSEKEVAKAAREMQKQAEREEKRQKDADIKIEEEAIAETERQEQARKIDSVSRAKQQEALAEAKELKQQRMQDSLKQQQIEVAEKAKEAELAKIAQQEEEEKPQEGEKYEEVNTEDGLEPGYYLIANVFGTKKYFDAFMQDLRNKGMQPKSFLRGKNNFNYAYLERYNT
ncbi:MAG: PorP/SprF family type IX secretion system membrane protein, partial [Pricia sp.]|nr:PorP/SprF family type IX secretion system membrane protein [Pricia sp.]